MCVCVCVEGGPLLEQRSCAERDSGTNHQVSHVNVVFSCFNVCAVVSVPHAPCLPAGHDGDSVSSRSCARREARANFLKRDYMFFFIFLKTFFLKNLRICSPLFLLWIWDLLVSSSWGWRAVSSRPRTRSWRSGARWRTARRRAWRRADTAPPPCSTTRTSSRGSTTRPTTCPWARTQVGVSCVFTKLLSGHCCFVCLFQFCQLQSVSCKRRRTSVGAL